MNETRPLILLILLIPLFAPSAAERAVSAQNANETPHSANVAAMRKALTLDGVTALIEELVSAGELNAAGQWLAEAERAVALKQLPRSARSKLVSLGKSLAKASKNANPEATKIGMTMAKAARDEAKKGDRFRFRRAHDAAAVHLQCFPNPAATRMLAAARKRAKRLAPSVITTPYPFGFDATLAASRGALVEVVDVALKRYGALGSGEGYRMLRQVVELHFDREDAFPRLDALRRDALKILPGQDVVIMTPGVRVWIDDHTIGAIDEPFGIPLGKDTRPVPTFQPIRCKALRGDLITLEQAGSNRLWHISVGGTPIDWHTATASSPEEYGTKGYRNARPVFVGEFHDELTQGTLGSHYLARFPAYSDATQKKLPDVILSNRLERWIRKHGGIPTVVHAERARVFFARVP